MENDRPVVLVVDDDADVLEALKAMLANEPYVVETYRSAGEAEVAITSEAPDIMIVDLMMEEIDAGAEFVRKARETGVKCPVYMLSAVGDELSRSIDQTELGLDGIVQKPVSKTALLSILRTRLRDATVDAG